MLSSGAISGFSDEQTEVGEPYGDLSLGWRTAASFWSIWRGDS